MQDYARFLIKRFAVPHFVKGVREVHSIFDHPGCIANTPKAVEQRCRDSLHTPPAEHEHYEFYNLTTVPSKWRDCLHCRHCKRQLVLYLGQAFQKIAADYLRGQQELVIAGCFGGEHSKNAIGITQFSCNTIPALQCNAEESDTRVWLHAFQSVGHKKLVVSPDTDVYNIGIALLKLELFDVFVQLIPINSLEKKLLHLNSLHKALLHDHDLALIPELLRTKVLQTLFICSGCDYVSFFAGMGKVTMMRHFFENAWFMCGTLASPGTLADTHPHSMKEGFMSFLRLVGSIYLKKTLVQLCV